MSQPPADDPFRHGKVDGPARAHCQRSAELTLYAFEQEIGQMGQRLRACAAVERLERAIEARIGYVVFVRHTFPWENLRPDPRMDEILAAVGL